MTYTEFTFIRFHGMIFLFEIFFITRNHGWRRCWLDYIKDKVAKQIELKTWATRASVCDVW